MGWCRMVEAAGHDNLEWCEASLVGKVGIDLDVLDGDSWGWTRQKEGSSPCPEFEPHSSQIPVSSHCTLSPLHCQPRISLLTEKLGTLRR